MIVVKVRDRDIKAAPMGPVTTGSVGLPVSWHFSEEWDDLAKTAVFRVGNDGTEITVAVLEDMCLVPEELLVQNNAGENLWIGVYGWKGTNANDTIVPEIAMPTIWTYTRIQDGSQPSGIEPPEGTPGWSEQIQNATDEALRVAHGVAADAAAGEFDGISPEVTIDSITHGHSVTITDREHPEGQRFPVLDGASAYEQAVAGGYEGTEEEFNADLADFSEKEQAATNAAAAAAQSAQNAAGSATTSTAKASEAADSAAAALTRMNSANSSAQAAAGSAGDASTAATTATTKAGEASDSATAADGSAKDSEAYAIGKRGGTDVGSTDPAYHNNAKYYAEQAAGSASDAAEVAPFYAIYGQTTKAEIEAAINGKRQIYLRVASLGEVVAPYTGTFMYADSLGQGTGYRFSLTDRTWQYVYELKSEWTSYTNDLNAPATRAEDAQAAAEQAQSDAETAAQSVSQSAAQIGQNTSDIGDLKSAVNDVRKSTNFFPPTYVIENKKTAVNGTISNNTDYCTTFEFTFSDFVNIESPGDITVTCVDISNGTELSGNPLVVPPNRRCALNFTKSTGVFNRVDFDSIVFSASEWCVDTFNKTAVYNVDKSGRLEAWSAAPVNYERSRLYNYILDGDRLGFVHNSGSVSNCVSKILHASVDLIITCSRAFNIYANNTLIACTAGTLYSISRGTDFVVSSLVNPRDVIILSKNRSLAYNKIGNQTLLTGIARQSDSAFITPLGKIVTIAQTTGDITVIKDGAVIQTGNIGANVGHANSCNFIAETNTLYVSTWNDGKTIACFTLAEEDTSVTLTYTRDIVITNALDVPGCEYFVCDSAEKEIIGLGWMYQYNKPTNEAQNALYVTVYTKINGTYEITKRFTAFAPGELQGMTYDPYERCIYYLAGNVANYHHHSINAIYLDGYSTEILAQTGSIGRIETEAIIPLTGCSNFLVIANNSDMFICGLNEP